MTEPTFLQVTINPNVKIIVPLDGIACIREPLPDDKLLENTRAIVAMKSGLNLFVHETRDYFMEVMGTRILRRADA
jgi:hypothetical protein